VKVGIFFKYFAHFANKILKVTNVDGTHCIGVNVYGTLFRCILYCSDIWPVHLLGEDVSSREDVSTSWPSVVPGLTLPF
jgi:hypothetical protein